MYSHFVDSLIAAKNRRQLPQNCTPPAAPNSSTGVFPNQRVSGRKTTSFAFTLTPRVLLTLRQRADHPLSGLSPISSASFFARGNLSGHLSIVCHLEQFRHIRRSSSMIVPLTSSQGEQCSIHHNPPLAMPCSRSGSSEKRGRKKHNWEARESKVGHSGT